MRARIDLGYDGAAFHGWAAQPGLRTVQGELELWLTRVLRTPVALTCAGRTDAGVHARGQVAHVDVPDGTDLAVLERRLRAAVPSDIAIWRVSVAPDGFDARFSAIWRRYVYRLGDGVVDPLARHLVASVRGRLDLDALNAAASGLLGLHDFAAFCRAREGATTIRTLQVVRAERVGGVVESGIGNGGEVGDGSGIGIGPVTGGRSGIGGGVVEVTVQADAFCHSMVRSLVGALAEVGVGRRDAGWLLGLLDSDGRCGEVPVLPAHGLVLEEVGYPPDAELSARAEQARTVRTLPLSPSSVPSPNPPNACLRAEYQGSTLAFGTNAGTRRELGRDGRDGRDGLDGRDGGQG